MVSTNGHIIEVKGVHKTYDTGAVKVQALRGVDLSIKKGEMVAIMGPSGCGKTTLLNCLSGLDDINQGEVIVDGNRINQMSERQRTHFRAQSMGFIFQSFNLLPVSECGGERRIAPLAIRRVSEGSPPEGTGSVGHGGPIR